MLNVKELRKKQEINERTKQIIWHVSLNMETKEGNLLNVNDFMLSLLHLTNKLKFYFHSLTKENMLMTCKTVNGPYVPYIYQTVIEK